MRFSRRAFLAGASALGLPRRSMGQAIEATMYCPVEWTFTSTKSYDNPFSDLDLDVMVRDPDGIELRILAFWSGSRTWRVRYSPAKLGTHTWRTVSTNATDTGLHAKE